MFTVNLESRPVAKGKPPRRLVNWTPLAAGNLRTGSGNAVLGLAEIVVGKEKCRYVVSELPCDGWSARAFRFGKPRGEKGTDGEADHYDAMICRNGQDCRCECRGFLRHGHCKHVDSARELIHRGLIEESPVNPEADVSQTEIDALVPENWGF